ncbi:Uncharacterised protein [Mycobacteroides abscessus subsp. abscessus]|nr:Uncharacterised protein [Mycobacteroides abscessus subsp. abscessus]
MLRLVASAKFSVHRVVSSRKACPPHSTASGAGRARSSVRCQTIPESPGTVCGPCGSGAIRKSETYSEPPIDLYR